LTAFIFSDLNYKMVIFLSQTESTPKHFFRKKALLTVIYNLKLSQWLNSIKYFWASSHIRWSNDEWKRLSSRTRMQFHPDPAQKLSTNLYDVYHCWECSE